jgi:uncharacterized protein YdhG (YjbR/CyaY superfamily)
MAKPTTVDEYLAALSPERREKFEGLRAAAREAAPNATESIAYDMPALRQHDRFVVSYGAYKGHYSLFPSSHVVRTELGDDIAPYLHGKGTIRFPEKEPIPLELVRRVVRLRVREVSAGRNGKD